MRLMTAGEDVAAARVSAWLCDRPDNRRFAARALAPRAPACVRNIVCVSTQF